MCTISYSYDALHNAPAHIGQLCNLNVFAKPDFKTDSNSCCYLVLLQEAKYMKLQVLEAFAEGYIPGCIPARSLISATQSSPL